MNGDLHHEGSRYLTMQFHVHVCLIFGVADVITNVTFLSLTKKLYFSLY